MVSAVVLGGQSFITSANADYIPLPPFGDCHVKLRTDSCYGDDDPIQWPQPYLTHHSHFAAILVPTLCLITRSSGGLPFLSSVLFLFNRVKRYQESAPAKRHPPSLQPYVKWLQQVLDQLYSVHMTFRHIEFVV